MKHLGLYLTIILIFILAAGSYFVKRVDTEYKETTFVLDTYVSISAVGYNAKEAVTDALRTVNLIDKKFNVYNMDSEITAINNNAGVGPYRVSDEMLEVLKTSLAVGEITQGAFDITVKPLTDLWDIKNNTRVPEYAKILEAKEAVGYQRVILNEQDKTVAFRDKSVKLDLGGIAKGYAGAEVARVFLEHGIKSGIGDLGGNVVIIGGKNESFFNAIWDKMLGKYGIKPWTIGIQTPFAETGEYMATIQGKDLAIVSSGTYERYFEAGGKLYHHIMDPKTGYPVDNKLLSTTIITKNSEIADGLSTATFVMGIEKGLALINNMEGTEAVFIDKDKNVYLTNGLKNNPDFSIVDESYHLAS